MAYVKASEVKRGDTVTLEDGRKRRVRSISKGFIPGSLFFEIGGDDWACVARGDEIETRRPTEKGAE